MSERQHPGRVEDYTKPFLVTTGVTLFMAFWVLASVAGFVAVLFATAFLDLGLKIARRGTADRA